MSYNKLRKGRVSFSGQIYFITITTHDRTPCFSDFSLGRLVVRPMRVLHEDASVSSLAWVLMPDHLHWIFQLGDCRNLAAVMKLFKGRSARLINKAMQKSGPVWQKAYYDHAIRNEEDIRQVTRYMLSNPLRAGLVSEIGRYPLWDAVWVDDLSDLCE